MWKLLIPLSCLIVFADASDTCGSLIQCEQPIRRENFFADTRSMMFKIQGEQLLNRVCGKVPALRTCVMRHADSCTEANTRRFTTFFKDTMDFICTPVGKPFALNTAKTQCTMNSALDQWFLQMKQTCETNFYKAAISVAQARGKDLQDSDICPLKSALDTCVKSAMNHKCGPEMAALIERMFHIWMEPVVGDFNCGNSWTTTTAIGG